MTGEVSNNSPRRGAERRVIEELEPGALLEAARNHRNRIKWQKGMEAVLRESARTRRLITAYVERTGRPKEDIRDFMWRCW